VSSDQDDDQFLERLADEILEGEAPVAQGSQEETPSRLAARRQADILAQIAAVHRASAAE
jgi:hypothetical protein